MIIYSSNSILHYRLQCQQCKNKFQKLKMNTIKLTILYKQHSLVLAIVTLSVSIISPCTLLLCIPIIRHSIRIPTLLKNFFDSPLAAKYNYIRKKVLAIQKKALVEICDCARATQGLKPAPLPLPLTPPKRYKRPPELRQIAISFDYA